jgi:hypothetical protein
VACRVLRDVGGGGDSEEQLNTLFGAKSETLSETFGTDGRQNGVNRRNEESESGPTWIRTRDQPVMSRWL